MDDKMRLLAKLKGKREGGTLKTWYIEDLGDGDEIAYGFIHGDRRFRNGSPMRTSLIVEIHRDHNIIETKNTYYPYEEEATEDEKIRLRQYLYGYG